MMFSTLPLSRRLHYCRIRIILLAASCILGCIAGGVFTNYFSTVYSSLMGTALYGRVSIVGAVIVMLPFLVSSYLIIYSKSWLVYPICASAVFMLTVQLEVVYQIFGSAGWLASLLLLFPSILCTPTLLYVAIAVVRNKPDNLFYPVLIVSGIGMIQMLSISPILASLPDT